MLDTTVSNDNGSTESAGYGCGTLSLLERLPSELLHQILSYLSARDLGCASMTCRTLTAHCYNDRLWADLVNANLGTEKIGNSGPFDSFRRLYASYYPSWFIPRSKIWFADTEHTGGLILARYDNRRGVIEAYRILTAEPRNSNHGLLQVWDGNPEVLIPTFEPKIFLWLDDPVVLLNATSSSSSSGFPERPNFLRGESRMRIESHDVFKAFSFCSKETPAHLTIRPDRLWPPPSIPSDNRVYRDVENHWSQWENPPNHVSQVCESAFRVRKWAHFRQGMPLFVAGSSEILTTYATLQPGLYTPTKKKPYQGIWVGDYEAHGCEFLLFLQHDLSSENENGNRDIPITDSIPESSDISDEIASPNHHHETGIIQQGSLEAIKLTGDPNVPRGERSFIADDIGPGGFVRIADESPFEGVRIVKSKGHVAGVGFRDGMFNIYTYTFILYIILLFDSNVCFLYLYNRFIYTIPAYPRLSRLCGPLLGSYGSCFLLSSCKY